MTRPLTPASAADHREFDDPDRSKRITKLIRNGYLYSGYDYRLGHYIFVVTERDGSSTTAFLTKQGLMNEADLYAD